MSNTFGRYTDYYVFRCKDCGSLFTSGTYNIEKCPHCGSCAIEDVDDARVCSECGKIMKDGYVFYDGEAYYCSDECLHKHFSEEEYQEAYENDDAYWTEW